MILKKIQENYYKDLRKEYVPNKIDTVFILESVPSADSYFYNIETSNRTVINTFARLLNIENPKEFTPSYILDKFVNKNYIILDALYEPIDKLSSKERRQKIKDNKLEIKKELTNLVKDKNIKIILVSKYVYEELAGALREDGWNILNKEKGGMVPFPGNGWQKKFIRIVLALLQSGPRVLTGKQGR
ncbi:MAG: hypothetical protein WC089_00485 [Candidatus Paceibacterota bacterium]